CLGGTGYVEESVLPRLYREAPVNAIWEGSGNVMCFDVLRAFGRDGEAARAVLAALAEEAGDLADARAAVDVIARAVAAEGAEGEARARREGLALLAAAAAAGAGAPAGPRGGGASRRSPGGGRARASSTATARSTARAKSPPMTRGGSSTAPCRRCEFGLARSRQLSQLTALPDQLASIAKDCAAQSK